jgi:hypothetical protein
LITIFVTMLIATTVSFDIAAVILFLNLTFVDPCIIIKI